MRLILVCAVTLLLAGCGSSNVGSSSARFGDTAGNAAPRPKLIVVTDFAFSPTLVVIDRNFTARLERKIGAFPTYERKQRTLERVNDEIVATMVATLRDAGLDAEPGSEEGLSLSRASVVVRGSLRPTDPNAKKNDAGIGGGHTGVTADVTLSDMSRFGKKQLLAFSAEPAGGKMATGKAAKAANASMAAALVAGKAAPEKLSPDVEAVARGFGRAIGDRILDYGRGQGWLDRPPTPEEGKPEANSDTKRNVSEAKPVASAAEAKSVKPRAAKQSIKPGNKPAAAQPDSAFAPEPADSPAASDDTPAAD